MANGLTTRYITTMTPAQIIKALRNRYLWREIQYMTGTDIRQLQRIMTEDASPSGSLAKLLLVINRHHNVRKELME